MLPAFIDRIEDGQIAVVVVQKVGKLLIPVKRFPFKVQEGMHLLLKLEPDSQSEFRTLNQVKRLRENLLKKSKG